jgi:hypothetical protein
MSRKKSKFTGVLAERLKPLRIGLLISHEERAQVVAERRTQEVAKLDLLREHYGIVAGPNQWQNLAIRLARECCPGFQDKASRGQPKKWDTGRLLILAGEFRRELDGGARNKAEAARRLAAREPWRSFMRRGRWSGKDKSRPPIPKPEIALLEQYDNLALRYRKVGEEAFLYDAETNSISEWEAFVLEALSTD